MKRLFNMAAFIACCAISLCLSWLLVAFLGVVQTKSGLRFAFGPAVVLATFAFTLSAKLHDLTEIDDLPVRVIERLMARISIIQLRLWVLIGAVLLVSVCGWVLSSMADEYVLAHWWPYVTMIVCVATLFAVTLGCVFYLPLLHRDYTRFRMTAVRDVQEARQRHAMLARLRGH